MTRIVTFISKDKDTCVTTYIRFSWNLMAFLLLRRRIELKPVRFEQELSYVAVRIYTVFWLVTYVILKFVRFSPVNAKEEKAIKKVFF